MFERLLELIKTNMPDADVRNANMDSRLIEDLGMDSVGMMMLSMSIEDEFDVRFDEPVYFATVRDVIEWLEAHSAK